MTTRPLDRVTAHVREPLYRDAYALVLANLISSALGLVYWAVAARLYRPEIVGIDAALISTMLFLSNLAQLNMRVALLRFVPEAGRDTPRFILACYLACTSAAVVVSVAFIATVGMWFSGSPLLSLLLDPPFAAWFIISTAFWSFFTIQDGLLTGLRRAVVVPVENAAFSAVKIVLLVVFALSLDGNAIFLSWTVPVPVIVAAVSAFLVFRLIPRHRDRTSERGLRMKPRRLVSFLALDYVASLFVMMTVTLLPIVVVAVAGPEQGAYFYLAWLVITSLQLIPNYLVASLTVEAVHDTDGLARHARRVLAYMVRLFAPAVVVVSLAAPWILAVFGEGYAAEGADLLRVGALGLIPYAVNVLFIGTARVQGHGRVILGVHGALGVLTLVVSAALLGPLGIAGVGFAWLISNTAVCIAVILLGLRPLFLLPAAGQQAGVEPLD